VPCHIPSALPSFTVRALDPILVADRFAELRARLVELLADLSDEDWVRPTAAPLWSVKDVAAHLLQGDTGILSRWRDSFRPAGEPIHRHEDLVELVNDLNAHWVRATRGLSPRVLRELLSFTGPQVEQYFASLDPFAMSGPVSWAGPDPAPVWFDLAREFTERWHHQQQIRDATERSPLYEPYFLAPVLDTFVRALPHSFRDVAAAEGTVVKLEISGDAGGSWFLRRSRAAWELFAEVDAVTEAEVAIPQDTAWRLFTKGANPERARATATVRGNPILAAQVFATIAVIG
jgi:uncharacterized protein (TIGR03083 family)